MEFRINIIFSAVVHATIFMAALVLAGKDTAFRFPERFTMVTLFEQPDARKTIASGTEKKKEHAITTGRPVARLREVSPPEVPPAARRQDKEQPAAVQQRTDPFEDGGGLQASSPVPYDVAAHQSMGVSGSSPGAMQLALRGKAATQGGREGGKNKKAQVDRNAVNTIRAAIEKVINYPPLARKRGIEGTATTEFTINSRGYPENIRILRSSGSDILDTAAKNTVLRASPFPPVNGEIEVPITFRIDR